LALDSFVILASEAMEHPLNVEANILFWASERRAAHIGGET